MSILINKNTDVLIQGITGNEGSRACREMLSYGTRVVAGVTPGKGGQHVENVPVYNTVREALKKYPGIGASLIAVPAPFMRDAAGEAIAVGLPLVDILTEHATAQDSAWVVAYARSKGVRVVGPSSVGIMCPGKIKIGSIGSSEISRVFRPGPVGIISKSGGMTAEIAVTLNRADLGQSSVVGIGGDQIIGSDFVDMLKLFKTDKQTRAVVLFGEVGGTYEEQAAAYISSSGFEKPVVAVIAGKFSQMLPRETVLGHAGAIVAKGRGSYDSKVKAFIKAGVMVAKTLEEVPKLLRSKL